MREAQTTHEENRSRREEQLQKLLDECPDEVLELLLQLLHDRERKPASKGHGG